MNNICKKCEHTKDQHFDVQSFNADRAMFGYVPNKRERKMIAGHCMEKDCKCKEFKDGDNR